MLLLQAAFLIVLPMALSKESAAWNQQKIDAFTRALKSGSAKEIAIFMPKKLRVGPCESETSLETREKIAKELVEIRKNVEFVRKTASGIIFKGFKDQGLWGDEVKNPWIAFQFETEWIIYCSEAYVPHNPQIFQ